MAFRDKLSCLCYVECVGLERREEGNEAPTLGMGRNVVRDAGLVLTTPKGLAYDEAKRGLVVEDEQREAFEEAIEVIQLRENDYTYTEIQNKTSVNRARIPRILNKQAEWFERADILDKE